GTNTRFKTSKETPFTLYINDFDENGLLDHIYAYYEGEKLYPVAQKDDLIKQIPSLNKQFIYYKDYAGKTIEQIFTKEQLSNSFILKVNTLESAAVFNNGDGSFSVQALPETLQFSPINTIVSSNFGRANVPKFFIAGNFSGTKPEEGR